MTGRRGRRLIIHSSDGLTWDRLDLSAAFDKAYFWDVTAYAGGFVIVGRVGEPYLREATESARGVPAAWTSADGVTWLAAEVEGSEAPGATLLTVVAGADGLFATGYPTEWTSWQSPRSGWASTDGRSWQLVGEMGTDLPLAIDLPLAVEYPTSVVGDGAHMVMFGRDSCKTTELMAWTSLDGVTWTQLAFSGETSSLPTIAGPICNDDGTEGSTVGSLGIVERLRRAGRRDRGRLFLGPGRALVLVLDGDDQISGRHGWSGICGSRGTDRRGCPPPVELLAEPVGFCDARAVERLFDTGAERNTHDRAHARRELDRADVVRPGRAVPR